MSATTTKIAYHGDPDFKARCVQAARHHAEFDRLRAGTYGEMNGGFHGCSVGCDYYDIRGEIGDRPHATTADYFGWPQWLEHLRDRIFEGLPDGQRNDFHVRMKEAVPVGADLEPVRHKLALRRLDRLIGEQTKALDTAADEHGLRAAIRQVITAMQQVRSCHEAEIGGNACDISAAWSAAESARSAAWSTAWSAARSARSAWSARSAAWSAAESAWSAAWSAETDDLIALLQEQSA